MHRRLSRRLLALPLLALGVLPAAGSPAGPGAAPVAAHVASPTAAALAAASSAPASSGAAAAASSAAGATPSATAASTATASSTSTSTGAAPAAAPLRTASSAPARQSPAPTASPSSGSPARPHLPWGVFENGAPADMSVLQPLEAELSAVPDDVMWYVHWGGGYGAFNGADVQNVVSRGETPVITWMSDDFTTAGDVYPLQQIAAGVFDRYVKSWADGLRAIHHRVLLRFDHEMNGNWSQWSAGVAGQTPADYVAAWRHLHDVFAAEGASNVSWVWSPNVVYTGSTALALLYPGDAYVDAVGLDGYNWGPTDQWHTWQSFAQVFLPTVTAVQALSRRPIMVTEVGCTTIGGDKAQWITDMFATLRSTPAITALVWFDVDKEQDWRIDSSPATTAAFKAGLAA
jgi:Glycosyl hydrolase family 26